LANPLVETKLYILRIRRSLVARPRLSGRLSRGSDARLTLNSAPAGFGKTTLLTAWRAEAATESRSVAWLSLDQSNRQPATFWTYVITALRTAVPGVGSGVLQLASAPRVDGSFPFPMSIPPGRPARLAEDSDIFFCRGWITAAGQTTVNFTVNHGDGRA